MCVLTTLPFSYDCCIFVPKNVAAGQSFPHGSCVPALVPPRRVPLAAPAASFPRRRMLLGVSPSERFAFLGVSARASETDWRHHDVTPPLTSLPPCSPLRLGGLLSICYLPKGAPKSLEGIFIWGGYENSFEGQVGEMAW